MRGALASLRFTVMMALALLLPAGLLERVWIWPTAWGLIAVWAAETTAKPDVANVALAAAGLVALYAAWPFARRRTT